MIAPDIFLVMAMAAPKPINTLKIQNTRKTKAEYLREEIDRRMEGDDEFQNQIS